MSSKALGFWSAWALVVGSQIGSSIFLAPSLLAPYGFYGVLGYAVSACGALVLTWIFSILCQISPKRGGPHVYVGEACGNLLGFLVGWTYWITSWLGTVAVITGTSSYLVASLQGYISSNAALTLLVILPLFVNGLGLKFTGKMELFLTVFKLIPLLFFPIYIMFFIHPSENLLSFGELHSFNLFPVIPMTFWGFVGLETGAIPAENVENPERNLPKAMIFGTLFVAGLYILNVFSIMSLLPQEALLKSTVPYALAAQFLGFSHGQILMAFMVALVSFSNLNVWIFTGSQIGLSLSRDGFLPKIFQYQKGTTPWVSLLFGIAILILFLTGIQDADLAYFIKQIIDVSVINMIFIYLLVTVSFLMMFFFKKVSEKFRLFYGILSSLGLFFCLYILWFIPQDALLKAILVPLTGLTFRFFKRIFQIS